MLVCLLYFAREAAGALGTRLSLRPLISQEFKAKLARIARRDREVVSSRHCEEHSDEAIHSFFVLCHGLLRFARNDGPGLFDILNLKRIGGRLTHKIAGGGFYT
jgi:hypothetical protein